MSPRFLTRFICCVAFAITWSLAMAVDWVVPAFNGAATGFGNYTSIAYYAAKHKVYVGILTDSIQRKGLLVYDTDSSGNIVGSARQYLSHPDPEPAGTITWVQSMLVDTRHNKLFLGMSPQDAGMTNPLVMWNLDANGEPIGSPAAYATGHPYRTVHAIVLHPTLNRLYTVGWGGAGVYVRDLDANGVPTGSPITIAAGGYGKFSLGIKADGSKLYLGTYPGVLEVFDLDANGNKTGAVRSYTATNYPVTYLFMSVNDRGVYYQTADNALAYWTLTNGEPTGTPVIDTGHPVLAVKARSGNTLVAAEKVTFTDAIDATTKTGGMRVREYSLNANGSLNAILNDTGNSALDRLTSYNGLMNVYPDPVVATSSLAGFLGNRFANLSIRTTLLSASVSGNYTPHFTSTSMSSSGNYLRFTYSSRYNKVYSGDGTNINIYNFATGVKEANVACANSTQVMAVDDQDGDGYLYIALSDGKVDKRSLNTDGIPTDEANVITTGAGSIGAMAVNTSAANRYVYLCCASGAAGTITGTNLIRLPGSSYFRTVTVDPVKGRIYAGSCYNAHSNLWVWRLNANGTYNTGPTTYSDGIPLYGTLRGFVQGLALNSVKGKLYLSASPEQNQGAGTGWLVTYVLDANGDPTTSTAISNGNIQGASGPLALFSNGTKLYSSGWGDSTIYIQPLDANGTPTGSRIAHAIGQYGKSNQLTLTTNNKLLAGSYPSVLEAISLNADGTGALAPTGTLTIKSQTINHGQLVPGVASAWTNLNTALKGLSGTALGSLSLTGATLTQASVKFEYSLDGGATILTSGTANLDGNSAEIFLPGYGVTAAQLANLPSWIRTSSEFYSWCLSLVPPDAGANRPQQFIIANTLFAQESNPDATNLAYQMLAVMGHNTIGGWGGAVPSTLHTKALANGLNRFKWGIYNPPSYFDFNTEFFTPGYQNNWAAGFIPQLANTLGAAPSELALFHMADEPGWYFPGVLNTLNDTDHPDRIAVFRTYLANKGFTPDTFGEEGWATVWATGQSQATTLPKMKLYYWTCRYFAESNATAFAASTAALRAQLNPNLLTTTNLNNWPGRYIIPSPNASIANNNIVGPDSAMGMPDWNELGRKNAVSCMWTEDWFSDQSAQGWSFYTDLLRCAAREGTGIEYGGYVVGQPLGAFPDGSGGPYKLMSLVGHGAKVFDAYVFGPNEIFGDGWSPSVRAYKPFTDAFHLLGQCESVLHPGRPRNGTVAILMPKASQPWDGDSATKQYLYEIYGVHYSLTHQQYPVDIIDDYDIENGALATYGYKTLYVTAPNLSVAAQTAIRNWVNAGGTLALFPGACSYDEYNQPATTLTSVMGASWPGSLPRANYSGLGNRSPRTAITVTDMATLIAASDVTPSQIAPLTVGTATSLATLPGGSAVTRQTYGAGRIFAYGYYPGVTYCTLLNGLDVTRLPQDWRADTRNILTAPARTGATPAPKFAAVNAELVEAALLEDVTAGIGITLLNWSGTPLESVTVSVNKQTMPANILAMVNTAIARGRLDVTSACQETLTYTDHPDRIDITLPLATVDVLMLTPRQNIPPTISLTAPDDNTVYPAPPATVQLTAEASDADGTITRVEFYQGTTLLATDTTSPYSYDWTNVATGNYVLTAKAYDDDEASATSNEVHIRVNALKGVLLAADPANVPLAGHALTFIATSYGMDNPEYSFSAKLKDIKPDGTAATQTIVPVTTVYTTTNTLTFTPVDPGSYTITVSCRETGTTAKYAKSLIYAVGTETLMGVAGLTADQPSGIALDALPGGGIGLTATVSGTGTGVQYFFSATLKDIRADGTYVMVPVTLSTAWGGSTFAWQPTELGSYTLKVVARDASCNISYSKTLAFLVRPAALKGIATFTADPASPKALDELPAGGITLTATPQGSGTGVEYFFSAKLKDIAADGTFISTAVTLSTGWGGNTFPWTPTQPGTYTLTVTARDATCNTTVTKTLAYTVKAAELKGVATFTANPPSGTALDALPGGGITLTATPDGSGTGVQYFFSAKLKDIAADGTYTTVPVVLSTGWGGNTFPWTPTAPGAYTLTVAARDASCNTLFTKTLAYTVKAAAVKGLTSFLANLPSGTALDALPGAGIQLTVTPDGSGTGVEYFYSAKLKDVQADGSYTLVPIVLSTVWGGNTYAWHPTEPGSYTLTVVARDASCNTFYSKTLAFTVLSPALKGITSFTPSVPSGKTLALIPPEGVLFTTLLNGAGTGVQYRYKVGKMVPGVGYSYTPLTAYTGDQTYLFPPAEFTPLTVGSYTVTVYAWDGSYNTTFSKTASYTIK